jgi:hypothetical protein
MKYFVQIKLHTLVMERSLPSLIEVRSFITEVLFTADNLETMQIKIVKL